MCQDNNCDQSDLVDVIERIKDQAKDIQDRLNKLELLFVRNENEPKDVWMENDNG